MSNPGEWTAVITAAGEGSRMTDLTNQCPKALLPVGRNPMIWYPIKMLERAGFSDIIIVTRKGWQDQIQHSLSKSSPQVHSKINIETIPDDEDLGTADSLRIIADKIKTVAVVVSCDVISDCDFSELISVHRKNNSSVTVMLSQLPSAATGETLVPGVKLKQKQTMEKVSIGFDSSEADRIVFWKSHVDMMEDEYVTFTRKFLESFPNSRIQSSWTDCHVYIINKFIIKYLQEKIDISSLSMDLVPSVVKKQMLVYVKDKPKEDTELSSPGGDNKSDRKKDLVDFAAEADKDLQSGVRFLSLSSDSFGMGQEDPQKDLIGCYVYRQTEGFCVRANTISAYFEACKQIPRLMPKFLASSSKKTEQYQNVPPSTSIKPKSQVGNDCMLGENVSIGEKVSIKKSVIGKNCTIGDKVKITSSVIMDNVDIQESSNIVNCIIANSVSIGDKSNLSNCIVAQNQTVSTMSKHTNEVLCQLMEVNFE